MIGIYKITSPTGRIYIGQSRNIDKRKSVYRKHKCFGQDIIFRSIVKYGFDAHKFEVVYEFDKHTTYDVIDNYEQFFISQFAEAGYDMMNLRPGGRRYGHSTTETKRKISNTLKSKNILPPSQLGAVLSPSHRAALIYSRCGRKNTIQHINSCIESNKSRAKTYLIYKNDEFIGSYKSWNEVHRATGFGQSKISKLSISGRVDHNGYKIIPK